MSLGARSALGAAVAGAMIVHSAAGLADAGASVPSVWGRYDLILEFNHLPKQYSCKDLWYKIRAVLAAVGAGVSWKYFPMIVEVGVPIMGFRRRYTWRSSCPRRRQVFRPAIRICMPAAPKSSWAGQPEHPR